MSIVQSIDAPDAVASSGADPLYVDLDGTLIRTDLFFESILRFAKTNPLNLVRVALWLLRGRAYAKDRVSRAVWIDAAALPYEPEMVEYLQAQKTAGRRLVLATASHRSYAEAVARHLGLFDHVIASDGATNAKGRRKLAAIREDAGGDAFAYAGDSKADRPIWRAASGNVLVNAPGRDVAAAEKAGKAEAVITSRSSVLRAFVKEMRVHQYAKNALIFVPLFTSHGYANAAALSATLLAFVCFSLCASGVYFLNDLLDLDADRVHARKRTRPLASGNLPIPHGVAGAALLPVVAFGLAFAFLPIAFVGVLAVYFAITNAYSFKLKRVSTADVMTLAVLYTLRVVAGGAATGIMLSTWLMAFSIFVFVSLAYLKRYIEISALEEGSGKAAGRGYTAADSETMFSLGIANITASVLVLAFYISSEEIRSLYRSPDLLWFLCLLTLYWGNRIWVGARRGKIHDDPVVFAIKDKVSRLVGLAFIAVALGAHYLTV